MEYVNDDLLVESNNENVADYMNRDEEETLRQNDPIVPKGNTERQVFTQDLRSSNFIPPSSMNVEFNAKEVQESRELPWICI
ncbi:uncharacterized protein LOC111367099 isoform X4 [Olea europaea var. sylvestris]|uniref:uncharacterized protein LOC111367099 isoform X4 n=1 Tax=Olea europaea var. sylvestris TaxID=158386 RepID=UPI000C1D1878|nr:uncharacterized protein LOC111367099 isoform X4 [Olea europaea var. sylvestris]